MSPLALLLFAESNSNPDGIENTNEHDVIGLQNGPQQDVSGRDTLLVMNTRYSVTFPSSDPLRIEYVEPDNLNWAEYVPIEEPEPTNIPDGVLCLHVGRHHNHGCAPQNGWKCITVPLWPFRVVFALVCVSPKICNLCYWMPKLCDL